MVLEVLFLLLRCYIPDTNSLVITLIEIDNQSALHLQVCTYLRMLEACRRD